ncbi:zinc finger domain-containing protein [Trichoderma sp. SZMC 28014]
MDMLANTNELSAAHESSQLERIGQGRCGTVWAARCPDCDGHSHLAMKREDGSTGRSISHEYKMHQKLLRAFALRCNLFDIPRSFGFLDSQDNPTWHGILPRLPEGYTGCNAIVSEKIMPVPASTRRLLIRKFRPDVDEEKVMNSSTNEHCLIRPYLGRRRYREPETDAEPRKRLRAFSLRNFPLHLDQMEQLGLDPGEYAVTMADALAFMHWVARVDGNDVEFVLARPRSPPNTCCPYHQKSPQDAHPHNTSIIGPHAMWILDFDLCRGLTLDESGVEQACNAFWGNDPWYPRPGRLAAADQKLWDIFEHRFLESSARALGMQSGQIRELPRLLVEKIKQTALLLQMTELEIKR